MVGDLILNDTGKKIGKLRLDDDKVMDLFNGYTLIVKLLSKGQLKKIEKLENKYNQAIQLYINNRRIMYSNYGNAYVLLD